MVFLSGTSAYGQVGVAITATVTSTAGTPNSGSVVFTDVLATNLGFVVVPVGAAADATVLNTLALPGALQFGQQVPFTATMKTSAAAAAGTTSLSVNALAKGLLAGMQFGFPQRRHRDLIGQRRCGSPPRFPSTPSVVPSRAAPVPLSPSRP